MTNTWLEHQWSTRIRQYAGIGLLGYLSAFFFLGPGVQKTVFYIAVALPGLLLIGDLDQLLRQDKNAAVRSFLFFILYFALSALWSDDGEFVDGIKRAASLVCLMLAINATTKSRPDAAVRVQRFIVIAGTVAVVFYCVALGAKIASSGDLPGLLAQRHSLRDIGGIGDSNPINGAIYLGVVTLAAWWALPRRHLLAKTGLLTLMACCTGLMFLTQSRGPFLALGATLFVVALTRRHRDDLLASIFALIAGIAAIAYLDLWPIIIERLSAPDYRLDIWAHSIGLIKDNLLFGQGLGAPANIPVAVADDPQAFVISHSHSSILETFRVGGVVGGLAFLVMLYCNARIRSSESDERRFFLFWLLFGILCLSTNGRVPMIRPSVEWFAFWIPMFLASLAPAPTGERSAPNVSG